MIQTTGYHKSKDITTDLTSGDVDFQAKNKTQADSSYSFVPYAIMIVDPANSVERVDACSRAQDITTIFYLQTNIIHELPLGIIRRTNTTTKRIIILGI